MNYPNPAAKFAAMSDEELFNVTMFWEGEGDAFRTEKAKRQKRIDEERARIAQERMERLRQCKEAVTYTGGLAAEICERLASGELLTIICLDEQMPTVRRVIQFLREHSDFKALYDQSLQDRLSIFEEQIIQIPDEAARDVDEVKSKGTVRRVIDPGKLTAAKLRVEVRRLHLKAGRPQKWSDSTTLITKSADDDPANMTPEELERQIADIEAKSRIVRSAA